MPVLNPEMTVLLMDARSEDSVPKSKSIRILHRPDLAAAESATNVFVLAAPEHLPAVRKFVQAADRKHNLRALLIRQDNNQAWLPRIMSFEKIRNAKVTNPFTDQSSPKRILKAWLDGVQEDLIADAIVHGEYLFIINCSLQLYRILFTISPLDSIPVGQRACFKIDPDGYSISWPDTIIELEMAAIRTYSNPKLRKGARKRGREYDTEYGRAVAQFRLARKLRQIDVPGLSARQLSRIESGQSRVTAAAIAHLAKAHGLAENEYMQEIARTMRRKALPAILRRRVRK